MIGNHDITLDEAFYTENGANFHSQNPQIPRDCIDLLQKSQSITYLNQESRTIRLNKVEGPHTEFKVFGSPYSPVKGNWGFQYPPENAQALWGKIPLDTDILITHTPPKFHCDESKDQESAGCEALREALWRVRPRLSIHGHVHEARGSDLVTWGLDCPNITFKEKATTHWVDPSIGTKKQSFLDLTSKGGEPIDWTDNPVFVSELKSDAVSSGARASQVTARVEKNRGFTMFKSREPTISRQTSLYGPTRSTTPKMLQKDQASSEPSDARNSRASDAVLQVGSAIRGRGGSPTSGRSDQEALVGRSGRKQTCVINAAIMATSWPYKGSGGERYNKPLVVDIDLPVWSGNADP